VAVVAVVVVKTGGEGGCHRWRLVVVGHPRLTLVMEVVVAVGVWSSLSLTPVVGCGRGRASSTLMVEVVVTSTLVEVGRQ